ncbi:MAG: PAS domain-containing protein [Proteobacteria bacterium]|nr:PAS domain-containing protein [Desulfobacula sp.]MBU3950651.1 PAS domain-containing protein [Pseudomonadota bacterium]MBU4131441.1 PAS domain-containing protein [Pseudomonadota bacterium]
MAPKPSYEELEFHVQELKNELARMKATEERTRLAIEAVNDGLFDFDMQQNETFFSARYYTMLGYEPYEMPASRETWVNLLHPEDRKWAVTHVDEQIKKKQNWSIEFRLRAKDGNYRWILGQGKVSAWDKQGNPIRRTGIHKDITDRKEAELAQAGLIKKLNKALKDVKTLGGLIPICSSCKKIRDDKGYWNGLESYFEQHSTALFSHSLCPGCMDEIYGKDDWYIEMKEKKKKD